MEAVPDCRFSRYRSWANRTRCLGHNLFGANFPSRSGSAPLRRWLHRQPLLSIAASAAIGIGIDSLAGQPHLAFSPTHRGVVWIFLTLVIAAVLLRRSAGRTGLCCALVFLPLAGCSRCLHASRYRQATILDLLSIQEQAVVLEGMIDQPVVLRRHPLARWRARDGNSPWQTQFELRLSRLRLGRAMHGCSGRLLVVVDADCSEKRPGDSLRVYGKLRAFSGPRNPGDPDRRAFYQQRQLHGRVDCVSADQLLDLDPRFACDPFTWRHAVLKSIASIASEGRQVLFRHLNEADASLAAALVLGQREFVDEHTRDLLLVTGTAHLLSVSGLHLAMVVALASWIANAGRFPLSCKLLWIVAVCLLYTAITGLRPPVVRAAILVGTVTLGLWLKRPGQPINTLSLAALILLGINPLLMFNSGVQLSFLAVCTLISCSRRVDDQPVAIREQMDRELRLQQLVDQSYSWPGRLLRSLLHQLRQAGWFSACVTAMSSPLIWLHFHVVAPISFVTNVVLSPLLLVALVSGVSTVALGLVFDPAAVPPAMVCQVVMAAILGIIRLAAAIPDGHHWLPAPSVWMVAVFYLGMGVSMLARPRRAISYLRYTWILLWFLSATWMATSPRHLPSGHLEAIFVDVGHGTSVIVRFDDDDVWLYDCGRLGNDTLSSRGIDSALWSLGVTRLHGIFLSHADADHFNALPGLLDRFDIGAIYTPAKLLENRQPAFREVLDAIHRHHVELIELTSGSVLVTSGFRMHVLHPPQGGIVGTDNANSLVLNIPCAGKSLLLPGDLESPGTEDLIRSVRPEPGGVLMAPHHGSLSMDAATILQWARPSTVIVSGGRRAGRPEVEQMLAQTGAAVHVTSERGAIRVRIDPTGQVQIQSWCESPW